MTTPHKARIVTALAGVVAAVAAFTPVAVAEVAPATLTVVYPNPSTAYLSGATCLVGLNSIPDFTVVSSLVKCGQTITFTGPVEKRSIPASWPVWGLPGQTEIPSPNLLYTNGPITLTIAFSTPRRIAGFELTPQAGVVQSFKADYIDASGNTIGQIAATISGGQARLIAAKTQPTTKVSSIFISSNGDFSIARLRFKP